MLSHLLCVMICVKLSWIFRWQLSVRRKSAFERQPKKYFTFHPVVSFYLYGCSTSIFMQKKRLCTLFLRLSVRTFRASVLCSQAATYFCSSSAHYIILSHYTNSATKSNVHCHSDLFKWVVYTLIANPKPYYPWLFLAKSSCTRLVSMVTDFNFITALKTPADIVAGSKPSILWLFYESSRQFRDTYFPTDDGTYETKFRKYSST